MYDPVVTLGSLITSSLFTWGVEEASIKDQSESFPLAVMSVAGEPRRPRFSATLRATPPAIELNELG